MTPVLLHHCRPAATPRSADLVGICPNAMPPFPFTAANPPSFTLPGHPADTGLRFDTLTLNAWGAPEREAGWCTYMANTYKGLEEMDSDSYLQLGGTIRRMVFLQCGVVRGGGCQRFYETIDEWKAKNAQLGSMASSQA